ncbi:MAG: DUF169 domain-containing protein [Clostridiales bacterium]|nr:DUF169 domain-containing protein [Clostridiales bacterium]
MKKEKLNEYGKYLETHLKLRTFPLAVKWYENLDEVPQEAIFPKRDMGKKIAFCQAKAMGRTKGLTIAMTKEDHGCWNPLVGFGCVECLPNTPAFNEIIKYIGIPNMKKAAEFFESFPRLPFDKYKAIVTAPLKSCTFDPDVVIIYANTDQTNYMLRVAKSITGTTTKAELDGIDSCIYATVVPFLTGQFKVTFPDPGDRERALARDDEVIFSIPAVLLDEFIKTLKTMEGFGMAYDFSRTEYPLDFPKPPFYTALFKMWGLE